LWVEWEQIEGGVGRPLLLRISPDSGLQLPTVGGQILRVTGHFNDPAASTCEMSGQPIDGPAISPETAQLYCREQFVLDEYEVIGTDPDFQL
jgi:hypothetical protein